MEKFICLFLLVTRNFGVVKTSKTEKKERGWSMENDIAGNGWYEKENEERS